MKKNKKVDTDPLEEMTFISHLLELRDRMLRMLLSILLIFLGLFSFANELYRIVAGPLLKFLPEGSKMIAIDVASPFFTPFKLALVASIFIAMPYILYELWRFVAPGLYAHERRMAAPLVLVSSLLFYAGMAFAYFIVFPLVFQFLSATTPEGVAMMTDISRYLDFVLTIFFAFGLAFQVPIATIVLVWSGATTPQSLTQKRPYIIVGAFVLGMLLTPPDAISQTLLAVPMWLLFEVGVFFSRLYQRKPEPEAEEDGFEEAAPAATSAVATTGTGRSGPVEAGAEDANDSGHKDYYEEDYQPMSQEEMDAEMDRIDEEMDELDQQAKPKRPEDKPDTKGDKP